MKARTKEEIKKLAREYTHDWSSLKETEYGAFVVETEDEFNHSIVLATGFAQKYVAERQCKLLNKMFKELADD